MSTAGYEHTFNYAILTDSPAEGLELQVNNRLENGYVLAGGPFMASYGVTGSPVICQAVYFPLPSQK